MPFLFISKAKYQDQSPFIWVRIAKDNVHWDAFRDIGLCETCGNGFLKLLFSSGSEDWTILFHFFPYIHSFFLRTIHVAGQCYQQHFYLVKRTSTFPLCILIQILIPSQLMVGQVFDTCLRLFTFTWSGKDCMGIKTQTFPYKILLAQKMGILCRFRKVSSKKEALNPNPSVSCHFGYTRMLLANSNIKAETLKSS